MADIPEPTPVEGWAQERRMGPIDVAALDEMIERARTREEAAQAARRARALTSVILLVLGALALLVGVTALLSWAWALLVFGMMCIIVSVMIGIERSSSANERGQ